MPISVPSLIRKAIGNIIDPEDIARLYDVVVQLDGAMTGSESTVVLEALTPGDDGQIKATVGGVVTNVKPGRIDARVRGMSTASSDDSTLLASLLTESGSEGSTLDLPEGQYRGTANVPSHARITGRGTIKAHTGASADRVLNIENVEDVVIDGIGLDGNGAIGGVATYQATDVTIRNIGVFGTAGYAYEGVRVVLSDGVTVETSTFDTANPVLVYNSDNAKIHRNYFVDPTGNAVTFWAVGATFVGHGAEVIGNRGKGLNRMGVEFYSDSLGSRYYLAPVIERNDWTMDDTPSSLAEAFAVSVPGARGARVLNNNAYFYGSGTKPAYAYEIIGPDHLTADNYAFGFGDGIILNSAPRARTRNNLLDECTVAINFAAALSDTYGYSLEGDTCLNPIDTGIDTYNVGGGGVIREPVIIRDKAFSGDDTRAFVGIRWYAQRSPTGIIRPRIVQGQASPTSGFKFRGIAANIGALGDLEDSYIDHAQFIDLKTGGSMMNPLFPNAGDTTTSDILLTNLTLTDVSGARSDVTSWVYA